jgi:hypothetical protein
VNLDMSSNSRSYENRSNNQEPNTKHQKNLKSQKPMRYAYFHLSWCWWQARMKNSFEITVGCQYPVHHFALDAGAVREYLKATQDPPGLSDNLRQVPSLLVAAGALAQLAQEMDPPPGTTHTAQELEFRGTVQTGERLTLQASVEGRLDRGDLHTLTTGFTVSNQRREQVLTGKITVACRSAEAKWRRK